MRKLAILAVLAISTTNGCTVPHTVDTVPAWKGIPLMFIAPNSLEGEVWSDYFHERKAARRQPWDSVRSPLSHELAGRTMSQPTPVYEYPCKCETAEYGD